jgi:hypothetical protein
VEAKKKGMEIQSQLAEFQNSLMPEQSNAYNAYGEQQQQYSPEQQAAYAKQ